MSLPPSFAWKIVLAVVLVVAILASAYAKAPRRASAGGELRRLVLSALVLYAVGVVASLTHHAVLAGVLYATGIAVLSLAAWLSRGSDSGGGPPRGSEPVDEQPPPLPDGAPYFDWCAFERELQEYSRRQRDPALTR